MKKIYHYEITVSTNYKGELKVKFYKHALKVTKETDKTYITDESYPERILKRDLDKFKMTPCNYLSKLVVGNIFTETEKDKEIVDKVIAQLTDIINAVKAGPITMGGE